MHRRDDRKAGGHVGGELGGDDRLDHLSSLRQERQVRSGQDVSQLLTWKKRQKAHAPGWRGALDGFPFGAVTDKQPARAGQVPVRRLNGDLQPLLAADAADVGDQRPVRVEAVALPCLLASGRRYETGQILRVANDVQPVFAQSVTGEFFGEALGEHEHGVGSLVGRVLEAAQQPGQRWASNHSHGSPGVDGQVGDFRDPGPALDACNEGGGQG